MILQSFRLHMNLSRPQSSELLKSPVGCRSCIEVFERGEHSIRGVVTKPCSLDQAMQEVSLGVDSSLDLATLTRLGAIYQGRRIKGQDIIKWSRIAQGEDSDHDPDGSMGKVLLEPQSLIRVHPRPKRYPACESSDWLSRVVFQDESLIIVDKPPNLPCMRHESNSYEVLAGCVSRGLGIPGLEASHRLDTWTSGLVVLSKTKEVNRGFKDLLSSSSADGGRRISKVYEAVSFKPVDFGMKTHFMFDGPFSQEQRVLANGLSLLKPRGPRLLSSCNLPGWKQCQLEILECSQMDPRVDNAWSYFNLPTSTPLFSSRVRLVTGRTHQIRAQLSALGSPLVGDRMYGADVMHELLVGEGGVIHDAEVAEAVSRLPQVDGRIGLHSASLSFGSISVSTPPPWS